MSNTPHVAPPSRHVPWLLPPSLCPPEPPLRVEPGVFRWQIRCLTSSLGERRPPTSCWTGSTACTTHIVVPDCATKFSLTTHHLSFWESNGTPRNRRSAIPCMFAEEFIIFWICNWDWEYQVDDDRLRGSSSVLIF